MLDQILLPFPGVPKPHPITERAFNQQPASDSAREPGAAAASKLLVKGLSSSPSYSSPENNGSSRAMTKGDLRNLLLCLNRFEVFWFFFVILNSTYLLFPSLASASTAGTNPNEQPSRSSVKAASPASTSAPSDTATNTSYTVPKLHVTGSRTLTLQARLSAPSE